MLPGVRDLEVYQGDTYIIPVALKEVEPDPDGGEPTTSPVDLTGHVGKAQIRRSPTGDVITQFEVKILEPKTDGKLEMRLPHEESSKLMHDCHYDLQTEVGSGESREVRTWLRGEISVTREITR